MKKEDKGHTEGHTFTWQRLRDFSNCIFDRPKQSFLDTKPFSPECSKHFAMKSEQKCSNTRPGRDSGPSIPMIQSGNNQGPILSSGVNCHRYLDLQ